MGCVHVSLQILQSTTFTSIPPYSPSMGLRVVERPVVLHAKKPLLLVCYNRE